MKIFNYKITINHLTINFFENQELKRFLTQIKQLAEHWIGKIAANLLIIKFTLIIFNLALHFVLNISQGISRNQ